MVWADVEDFNYFLCKGTIDTFAHLILIYIHTCIIWSMDVHRSYMYRDIAMCIYVFLYLFLHVYIEHLLFKSKWMLTGHNLFLRQIIWLSSFRLYFLKSQFYIYSRPNQQMSHTQLPVSVAPYHLKPSQLCLLKRMSDFKAWNMCIESFFFPPIFVGNTFFLYLKENITDSFFTLVHENLLMLSFKCFT